MHLAEKLRFCGNRDTGVRVRYFRFFMYIILNFIILFWCFMPRHGGYFINA